jgi:thioredoxin-like negative regulator of GroEL
MSDLQRASASLEAGEPQKALAELEPLESTATPDVALMIANARSMLGDSPGAARTLAGALARHPGKIPLVSQCARHLLDCGDIAAASALLEPLSNDTTPSLALMVARARAEAGDAAGAEAALIQSLERNSGHRTLMIELAKLHLDKGDSGAAMNLLASLGADDVPAVAMLSARAHAAVGNEHLALAVLEQALARHANDPGLIRQCARYRLKAGDAAGALALLAPLEMVAEPGTAVVISRARLKIEGAQSAADTLARALQRYPGNLELSRECARHRLTAGDAKGALALLAPLADVLPPQGLSQLARAALESGETGAAESIIVRALERFPGDPVLIGQLATLCLDSGRSREAVALLAQIEDIAPPAQLLVLAKARLFVGDVAGAEATLVRAVERFPDSAEALEGLASARLSVGNPIEALSLLDRVPEPRGIKWYSARARANESLGDLAAFEAAIRQGLAAFPDDLLLLSDLAKLLAAQSRLDEAGEVGMAIEEAAVSNPTHLDRFVSSYLVFGDARGAANIIARIVSKLEKAASSRTTATALIQLIPAARLLLPEIGVPIIKRILARLGRETVALSVEQQIAVATACAAVGDERRARQHLSAFALSVERAKDIIEAMSLAVWSNDEPAVEKLCDLLRDVPDVTRSTGESRACPFGNVRTFSERNLGALGFDVGGTDVAILFPGFYHVPSDLQSNVVQGVIARGVDVIRLFDMRRDVFLSGIGPSAGNRMQSADALKRLISSRGYGSVICVGTSGGGMPAALYGDAIGAERVVVFSTGTFFPADDDPLERRARGFLERVRKLGLDEDTDNLEIWRRPGTHPRFEIHFPSGNPQDARHALRMAEAPNVALHPVETASHDFFMKWSADALGAAITGSPSAAPSAHTG